MTGVELADFAKVTDGSTCARSSRSWICRVSSSSLLTADTERPTSFKDCSRFCAVTTISSNCGTSLAPDAGVADGTAARAACMPKIRPVQIPIRAVWNRNIAPPFHQVCCESQCVPVVPVSCGLARVSLLLARWNARPALPRGSDGFRALGHIDNRHPLSNASSRWARLVWYQGATCRYVRPSKLDNISGSENQSRQACSLSGFRDHRYGAFERDACTLVTRDNAVASARSRAPAAVSASTSAATARASATSNQWACSTCWRRT